MGMQVRGARRAMVRFLRVDVKKRRLDEAPEEGCKAQNSPSYLHELPTQLTIKLTGFVPFCRPLGVGPSVQCNPR